MTNLPSLLQREGADPEHPVKAGGYEVERGHFDVGFIGIAERIVETVRQQHRRPKWGMIEVNEICI